MTHAKVPLGLSLTRLEDPWMDQPPSAPRLTATPRVHPNFFCLNPLHCYFQYIKKLHTHLQRNPNYPTGGFQDGVEEKYGARLGDVMRCVLQWALQKKRIWFKFHFLCSEYWTYNQNCLIGSLFEWTRHSLIARASWWNLLLKKLTMANIPPITLSSFLGSPQLLNVK